MICVVLLPLAAQARAQDTTADSAARSPSRPAIKTNRWQEDWSALASTSERTQALDRLKYLPLVPNGAAFLSLGATLRERLEINDAAAFGAGDQHDTWLSQRLQVHADARLGSHWEAFVQVEDVRSFGKRQIGPADQNRLDLRLAFVAYEARTRQGTFKARAGRQDFAFDLQRFVSSRDGPGVRQSFDAVWADWESGPWRVLGLSSHPVQYRDGKAFDDVSNGDIRFDVVRVERHVQGENELSAYYAHYGRRLGRYGDAIGPEDRDVLDARYAATIGPADWDLETMVQRGTVGSAKIRAWALGARGGYTFQTVRWQPRLGLQFDAASGDPRRSDGRLETFNPLFPNGFYFSKAGYTGYANLIHLKPSVGFKPTPRLSMQGAVAAQWRQTSHDAIYTTPNLALPGSAGVGGRWTGAYGQANLDYRFSANLTGAVEAVHFSVGDAVRAVGGHDSDYLGVELKLGW
ncbi:MAG: alginate export family protein [Caulobacter sp.]|nr:alginate export family protein [Caulobacter sp.]